MSIFKQIKSFIDENDIEGFKAYLDARLKERPDFLQQSWYNQGRQMTLLGYLINRYEERPEKKERKELQAESLKGKESVSEDEEKEELAQSVPDLAAFIMEVTHRCGQLESGAPIHQAIKEGKLQLAQEFIKMVEFPYNLRDADGNTLLKLALETKDEKFIQHLLSREGIYIHESFKVQLNSETIEMQAIHLAIYLNLPAAVQSLAVKGADLNNPCGQEENYPVHCAAQFGSKAVLSALLHAHSGALDFESKNARKSSAIELACLRLKTSKDEEAKQESLAVIAMLLCHGAKTSALPLMNHLLIDYRKGLLAAIGQYLENKADLVEDFVERCYSDTQLHSIFFDENPLSSPFRHLLGRPSMESALTIAGWVTRKYEQRVADADGENVEKTAQEKHAEYIIKYNKQLKSETLSNGWHPWLWRVAKGETNWGAVKKHAEESPNNRTAGVVKGIAPDSAATMKI